MKAARPNHRIRRLLTEPGGPGHPRVPWVALVAGSGVVGGWVDAAGVVGGWVVAAGVVGGWIVGAGVVGGWVIS